MVHLRLRRRVAAGLVLLAAGIAPPAALAAGKPVVTTGGAASVTQSTATLTGTVTQNGAPTTYFFQYGPTVLYGAQTAATAWTTKTVAVPIAGLAPFTTYHYRLIAQNSHGITRGKDRTFKTKRQPLGLSLISTPNPVPFGKPTTVQGVLSGTGNAGRAVVLQSNAFPYTAGFANAGNAQVTNAQGQFFFPLLSLPINTQFRVVMTDRPDIVSPIITVFSEVHVSTHIKRRGSVARFFGSVTPAADGQTVLIKRLSHGRWRFVAQTTTRHHSATSSSFSKHVRIRHSGRYRVEVVVTNGQYSSTVGHSHHLRRR